MHISKRAMTLILFLFGALIASGCTLSKEQMMLVNESREAFQKATLVGAKKCAPVEYATAEAYLALVDHEVDEGHYFSPHLFTPINSVKIVKDKSLEAIKICEKPPTPAPRAAPTAAAPGTAAAPTAAAPGAAAAPTAATPGAAATPRTAAPASPAGAPSPAPALIVPTQPAPFAPGAALAAPPAPPMAASAAPAPSAPAAALPAPPAPPKAASAAPAPSAPAAALPAPPAPPTPSAIAAAPAAKPAPPKTAEFDNVYFDIKKSNISPVAAKTLDRNGMMLKDNPKIKVEIAGHTDPEGSEEANLKISEKRALSVKKYIQDRFNIPEDRMTVKAYGSNKPVADNNTREGRAKNRRVEFKIIN